MNIKKQKSCVQNSIWSNKDHWDSFFFLYGRKQIRFLCTVGFGSGFFWYGRKRIRIFWYGRIRIRFFLVWSDPDPVFMYSRIRSRFFLVWSDPDPIFLVWSDPVNLDPDPRLCPGPENHPPLQLIKPITARPFILPL